MGSAQYKTIEEPESTSSDRSGRPSPVSVLEPLFSDNEISPASNISRPGEQLHSAMFTSNNFPFKEITVVLVKLTLEMAISTHIFINGSIQYILLNLITQHANFHL